MDVELFYSFYRLVTSAASDGLYLPDAAASGNPLMTITYTYLDPAKAPDVMTLYAGGTRRVNVDVNGVIEFDMRASFVDAMKPRLRTHRLGRRHRRKLVTNKSFLRKLACKHTPSRAKA